MTFFNTSQFEKENVCFFWGFICFKNPSGKNNCLKFKHPGFSGKLYQLRKKQPQLLEKLHVRSWRAGTPLTRLICALFSVRSDSSPGKSGPLAQKRMETMETVRTFTERFRFMEFSHRSLKVQVLLDSDCTRTRWWVWQNSSMLAQANTDGGPVPSEPARVRTRGLVKNTTARIFREVSETVRLGWAKERTRLPGPTRTKVWRSLPHRPGTLPETVTWLGTVRLLLAKPEFGHAQLRPEPPAPGARAPCSVRANLPRGFLTRALAGALMPTKNTHELRSHFPGIELPSVQSRDSKTKPRDV